MRFLGTLKFICAAVILTLLLSGCGRESREGDGLIHLRWVTYETSVPSDIKEVIAAANAYSAEKTGVVVDLELQPAEMINLIMASGEYYDIMFTSEWLNRYDTNAAKGMYYDITDLVKEETPALYDVIGEYWEAAELDGRLYGVPTLKDMGSEMMFRFNSDYFEGEKGMEIPEMMEFKDVEPFLKAYKEDHPNKYPLAMDKSGIPGFTNFLDRVISTFIFIPYGDDEPKAIPLWESEELMERYRLLHKWYKLGYIDPDASAIESTAADKSIPVRFGVAWRGYQGYSNPDDWGFNVKTSIYDGPYMSRATEQGALLSICSACSREKAVAALKYIELLNTDRRFRDILGYGIEGRHFEYLENHTVLRTQTGHERYNVHLYPFGSVVNASVESISRDLPADPDQWEKVYEGYREYAIKSKTKGFVYDQTRKADIIAAVTAIYTNYSTDLMTGTSDPDTVIPKMRAQMEAAGINELLDDINGQLKQHLNSR
ncbi:MAG: ABC transporter substrate-binding protein [Lachnospiraceae bacterium]|nr:ABC transporter substrate-binding protein [Lachnospiraceae bacterium]